MKLPPLSAYRSKTRRASFGSEPYPQAVPNVPAPSANSEIRNQLSPPKSLYCIVYISEILNFLSTQQTAVSPTGMWRSFTKSTEILTPLCAHVLGKTALFWAISAMESLPLLFSLCASDRRLVLRRIRNLGYLDSRMPQSGLSFLFRLGAPWFA